MSLDPLLPGELRDDHDGRRSARDWLVDGLMYLVALAVAGVALADSWDEHSTVLKVVDLTLGAIAFVALWWRRRYPGRLGVAATLAAGISAAATGPGADRRLQRRGARLAPRAADRAGGHRRDAPGLSAGLSAQRRLRS